METISTPAAWYVRKSDSKSDLERQINLLEHWCEANKVKVPDALRYKDMGSRDLSRKRPDFQRMLKDAKRGLFKTIIVPALDRFGVEDTEEFFRYRSELRDSKVSIFSIDPSEGDLSSKDKETIIKIFFKAEASKEEQQKKGSRSISGKHSKLTPGSVTFQGGPTPYGYDKQCQTDKGEVVWTLHHQGAQRRIAYHPDGSTRQFDGDKTTAPLKTKHDRITLVPSMDATRIEVVKLIFQLWTQKDLTILGICKRLNTLGYRHYEDFWKPTSVRGILNNPVYGGCTVFNRKKVGRFASMEQGREIQHPEADKHKKYERTEDKWVIVPDTHDALVAAETVEAARKKLKALTPDVRPPRHPDLWLRRFAVCGHCGNRLQSRHIGKYAYLFCGTSKDAKGIGTPSTCNFNSVRHDALERIVSEQLGNVFDKLKGQTTENLQKITKDYLNLVQDWWQIDREFVQWVLTGVAFKFGIQIDSEQWTAWKELEAAAKDNPEMQDYIEQQRQEWDSKRTQELSQLETEHRQLTRRWAVASDEQLPALTAIRDEIEEKIRHLRGKVSTTVIEGLDALLKLAAQFKEQLKLFKELSKSDDGFAKSEALKPVLKEVKVFFKTKEGTKAKSHVEKCEFVFCDGNEGYATVYTTPRSGRPVRAGSSSCW